MGGSGSAVDMVIHRPSGSGETLVSSGVMLPEGLLAAADLGTVVLTIGGTEKSIYVEALDIEPWEDGTMRGILLQFTHSVSAGSDIAAVLTVDGSPQEARDSRTTPPAQPTALCVPSDPDYLVTTRMGGILPVMRTVAEVSAELPAAYAAIDTKLINYSNNNVGANVSGTWLTDGGGYDVVLPEMQLWMRTGTLAHLIRAVNLSHASTLGNSDYYNGTGDAFYAAQNGRGVFGLFGVYLCTGSSEARWNAVDQGRLYLGGVIYSATPMLDGLRDALYGDGTYYYNEGRMIAKPWQGALVNYILDGSDFQWLYERPPCTVDGTWEEYVDECIDLNGDHLTLQGATGTHTTYHANDGACYGQKMFMEGIRNVAIMQTKFALPSDHASQSTLTQWIIDSVDAAWDAEDYVDEAPIYEADDHCWKYIWVQQGANGEGGEEFNWSTEMLNHIWGAAIAFVYDQTSTAKYATRLDEMVAISNSAPQGGAWWTGSQDYYIKGYHQCGEFWPWIVAYR